MVQYLNFLHDFFDQGEQNEVEKALVLKKYNYSFALKQDNDGMIYDFPLLTTKKMSLNLIFTELMWKLRGETNLRPLLSYGNDIWTDFLLSNWLKKTGQFNILDAFWQDDQEIDYSDEWKNKKEEFKQRILDDSIFCKEWGELGKTPGSKLREFGEIEVNNEKIKVEDPLMSIIDIINNNSNNNSDIVIKFSCPQKEESLIPMGSFSFRFVVDSKKNIHLESYYLYVEAFHLSSYYIVSDGLFLCLMAHVTGCKPGNLSHTLYNPCLYWNKINQTLIQVTREPNELPKLKLNPDVKDILYFQGKDLKLFDYHPMDDIFGVMNI